VPTRTAASPEDDAASAQDELCYHVVMILIGQNFT
jgi:hypothetical protein